MDSMLYFSSFLGCILGLFREDISRLLKKRFFSCFAKSILWKPLLKAVVGNNAPFQHSSLKGERTLYNLEKQMNEWGRHSLNLGEKKDIYAIYTSRLEVGTSVQGFISAQKKSRKIIYRCYCTCSVYSDFKIKVF